MSLHHKHFFSLFSRKFKVDSYDSLPIMESYILNQFYIKIKITTTIRYFLEKCC